MDLEKKLYKSTKNKIIDGVCGGIGEYCNIDPTLVRLACVAIFIFSAGSGLLAYIIALIIIPRAPEGYDPKTATYDTTATEATEEPRNENPAADQSTATNTSSDSDIPTIL